MAKSLGKRITKFVRNRWWVLAIGAVVLVAGYLAINAARTAQSQSLAGLQTASVARGELTATIGATGSVRAQQSATLTWGTSGKVESVDAFVGQHIASDDILASLELASMPQNIIMANIDLSNAQDALDLEVAKAGEALAEAQNALEDAQRTFYNLANPGKQVDIDQALANMVLAKDKLDKARDDYEPYADKPETNLTRANYLLRFTEAQQQYDAAVRKYNAYSGTSSDTDLAVAQGNVQLAQAQLEVAQRTYDNALKASDPNYTTSAEAQLAAAQATVDLAHIKAPFAGEITDAFPLTGDLVSPGEIAFQLDDLSHMLVDVEVSEVDINSVAKGQPVTLTFDATPDKEYNGEVTSVAMSGTTDGGVVNFRVTVELTDADDSVRPDMTAAVSIVVTQLQDVLLVPNRAVRLSDGQRTVYVLRNGAMQQVEITLGASSDTYSEVIGGDLHEGDTIVLNPPANAFDFTNPPQGGGGQFLLGGSNQ